MITSLKQGILEINEYSVNSDQREEDQELQLLGIAKGRNKGKTPNAIVALEKRPNLHI